MKRGVNASPSVRVEGGPAPAAKAWPSAPTSMGSPRGVPVPCRLTSATSRGIRPATDSAVRISAVCAGPLGAVSPLERPAWLYALPERRSQLIFRLSTVLQCRHSTEAAVLQRKLHQRYSSKILKNGEMGSCALSKSFQAAACGLPVFKTYSSSSERNRSSRLSLQRSQ